MLASIDVGSNTVRMLIGSIEQGRLCPERYERAITRLGGGFIDGEGLAPASMERTLAALAEFAEILPRYPLKAVRMVGTAALRRAENRAEFVAQVARWTGLELEIIDGNREARLSARGVLAALDPRPAVTLIVDIGGGSTELVLVEGTQVRFRDSYPLGVVRLCEEQAGAAARRAAIDAVLDRFSAELAAAGQLELLRSAACELVGTAGTVTTLAAIDQQMEEYDWRKVNNYRLALETLSEQYALLKPLTVQQRERLPGLEAGRGDLIMPGIEVLLALARRFSRPQIRVSDFGLLEGILLELAAARID